MSELEKNPVTISEERIHVYPILKTRRVLLSQHSKETLRIRIDYSLNLARPQSSNNDEMIQFLNSRQGRAGANISFLVLDDRNASLIADLSDPSKTRSVLKNQQSDDRFRDLFHADGYHKIPLKDALLQNTGNQNYTTVTDTGGVVHHETHNTFEFEYRLTHIPEPGRKFSIFSSQFVESSHFGATNLSKLHLVGFIETPYLIGQNENAPEELKTIPRSELTYDLLLDKVKDQITGDSLLRPPSTREIFYVQDENPTYSEINLRPYAGPAHYHGNTNPGPEGFVGWMAGHAPGKMGPKLSVRSVPNHKVSVDAPPWNSVAPMPSIGHRGVYDETGSALQELVSSVLLENEINDPHRRAEEMLVASISAATRNKRASFVEPWSRRHTWITKDENEDDEFLDSSYNCIIGVKFLEILEHHSPFGGLISHFKKTAMSGRDNNSPQLRLAKTMLARFMKNSKILDLSIVRRRLDQRPYNNNDQDTKTYSNFEENQKNKLIIQAFDSPGIVNTGAIIPASWTSLAEIEEVRMDFANLFSAGIQIPSLQSRQQRATSSAIQNTQSSYVSGDIYSTRSFLIRDYELFYNLDYGKYTYDVELMVLDGSKSLVNEFRKNLSFSKTQLELLIEVISAPVIRNSSGRLVAGNYDYSLRRFVSISRDTRDQAVSVVRDLVDHVRNCLVLMTGVDPFPTQQDIETLVEKADPGRTTTTLDSMQYLITESDKILNSLEKLMQETFQESGEAASNNTEEIYVPNATGHAAPIIHVKCNSGVVHDASDTLKMVANYGIVASRLGTTALDRFIESAKLQASAAAFSGVLGSERDNMRNPGLNTNNLPGFPRIQSQNPQRTDYSGLAPNPRSIYSDPGVFMPMEFTLVETKRLAEVELGDTIQISGASKGSSSGSGYTMPDPNNLNLKGIGATPSYTLPGSPKKPGLTKVSTPKRSAKSPRKSFTYSSGKKGSIIKIEKSQFDAQDPAVKAVEEAKILTMMQEDSHVLGAGMKSPAFDARFLSSTIGGMTNTFSGFDVSASSRDIASVALNSMAVDSSLLSDGIKSAILDTAIQSETEEEFLRKVDDNYKELLSIRDNLKGLYTIFNRLVSLTKISFPSSFDNQKSKNLFEMGADRKVSKSNIELAQTPFEKKGAKLFEYGPTGDSKIHDATPGLKRVVDLQKTIPQNNGLKTIKLFKLEPMGGKDNIPSVNNALLVELN